MKTITITLKQGINKDDVNHKEAEIRLATVKDILDVENLKGERREHNLLAKRVVRLGGIENPGPILLEGLTQNDFARLSMAAQQMDAEDLQDITPEISPMALREGVLIMANLTATPLNQIENMPIAEFIKYFKALPNASKKAGQLFLQGLFGE